MTSEAHVIRQVFLETIDVLGDRAVRAIIEDLQRYHVFLYDQNLSLRDLASGLREMMGEETTQFLIERIYLKLDELYGSTMPA